jgi:3-isopropylmalate dehydrogenase
MVRNPEWFDVVVTSNMFGDIVTDLGSVLQGGMGMAASANIGDEHGLFEPVHGSTPKYAGKNKVNPIATINSVQLMIEWLGMRHNDNEAIQVSQLIEKAVSDHLQDGSILTYDLGGKASTSEVGSSIVNRLSELLQSQMAHSV